MLITDVFAAAQQLGWDQAIQNGLYRTALRLGWYKLGNPKYRKNHLPDLEALFTPADRSDIITLLGRSGLDTLLAHANSILDGKFERFGAGLAPIDLSPTNVSKHWSDLERGAARHTADIKEIWEPARFAWAIVLGRAFYLTQEQKYLNGFLSYFHQFIESNPIDFGPNWTSGQEVGIRLINTLIAARLFENALTEQTKNIIAGFTIAHADRVRKTLIYARSQNNNHFLVESIALLTAARSLPRFNRSRSWYRQGWKGIEWCARHQIHADGEYVQHSTNYHRLMLQAMVWAVTIEPELLDHPLSEQILLAIDWLNARVDRISGGAPNLGANDGALLFPLDNLAFTDHRGVLQQALRAFTITGLRKGSWDEGALWLGLPEPQAHTEQPASPSILRADRAWADLRVIEHTDRPSHADHLHLDLWWKGANICVDPGTYSYNLPRPWDNALTSANAHNTVTVNGSDQMRRVIKFLYLDWGNSWIEDASPNKLSTHTDVWEHLGITHERQVELVKPTEWKVKDSLTNATPRKDDYVELCWNFPDAPWTVFEAANSLELTIRASVGKITIRVNTDGQIKGRKLVRGGARIHGDLPAKEIEGWVSRGYLTKSPCLTLIVRASLPDRLSLTTSILLDEV